MKKLITFEVDTDVYWDTVAEVGDGGHAIGARLACVLLAPNQVSFLDAMGMAVYGVTVASVTNAPSESPSTKETSE
ncbi:hypothetical protein [Methylobacterium sp. 1973]|uniref:hypothetical protein n=1 Tax=Methylobacterium sp. 1973 TaxID=3156421 RepID=UPI003398D3C2